MTRRALILGVTGMLGHALMRELSGAPELDVYGSVRSTKDLTEFFPAEVAARITSGVDVTAMDRLRRLLQDIRPDVVVNAVGLIKQAPEIRDAVRAIAVNALFPHLLAEECAQRDVRLIHVSTDCVFSGTRGNYVEADIPDPPDLYGRSKLLGETTRPSLTLRTSIIGHELTSSLSLVDWFLSQTGTIRGYTRAIYTGVTTPEFARLLRTIVLPRTHLAGLYHVAAEPISKYELLRLIAQIYGWSGEIAPDDSFICDRSMSAEALFSLTGYRPPPWHEMVSQMHEALSRWKLPACEWGA
jgi:dTDP-4-dehydrorhamnose reductase